MSKSIGFLVCVTLAACVALPCPAQASGSLSGTVSLAETGSPLHGATVLVVELGRSTLTGGDGSYTIADVPAGTYHVVAHLEHIFTERAQVVSVQSGEETTRDFLLSLTAEKQEITVTASGRHDVAFASFQDVETYDAFDLATANPSSLGEALDHQVGTGIAKRSFGPGAARPIIRGFDGDRVLVMEDGIRTGTLASQSGDHGEVVNIAQLDSLEVVKGPATLLYSGNAMGGTVNAVSRHHQYHRHPHQGFRGYLTGNGGTANAQAGGNAGFELGIGRVQMWGQGGGSRTGDYTAPEIGEIFNSRSNLFNGGGGIGWYGSRMYFDAEFRADNNLYGVPFVQEFHGHGHGEEDDDHAEENHDDEDAAHEEGEEEEIERIALDGRKLNYRANWGIRDLGPTIESFDLKLSYTDWTHDEVEHFEGGDSEIGTTFDNSQFVYRGVFEQSKRGPLAGRFGFWGIARDYMATGEEALTPPVDQRGLALFVLEELEFERFKLQFGARLETQRYRPAYSERHVEEAHDDEADEDEEHAEHEEEAPDAIDRNFTGASAAFGVRADLWKDSALVVNCAHSFRVPSLEELYNFGPHAGTLAFEVGDPGLKPERGNGADVSLRQDAGRVRGEFNAFYYAFSNFVFPFATGEQVDGLAEIEFTQRNARFAGAEASLDIALLEELELSLGMDYVDAQETLTGIPLPRIPPLRGKLGLNLSKSGFQFGPELILASDQHQTFTNELRTPGYAVLNLNASYVYAQRHMAHLFSVNVFNAGDRLYRNHSSFIKDLAPEIGRGVRFAYTVRFF